MGANILAYICMVIYKNVYMYIYILWYIEEFFVTSQASKANSLNFDFSFRLVMQQSCSKDFFYKKRENSLYQCVLHLFEVVDAKCL